MSRVRAINCPTCLRQVVWNNTNPHRPFCSERCKLIDLGDWASGKHTIPGETVPDYEAGDLTGIKRDDYLD